MRFTLIVATKGRVDPLHILLRSLRQQVHRDFRVVVVDQNPAGTLDHVLADYRDAFPLQHILSDARGLSAARNVGLREGIDDVVAFPDDDCFFDPLTLLHAERALSGTPACDVVLGWLHVPEKAAALGRGSFQAPAGRQESRTTVFRAAGSVVHFYRSHIIRAVGDFDTSLGAGAGTPYGSGEDSDYLVRAVDARALIRRCACIRIYHPDVDSTHPGMPVKAFGYGRGRMRVIRKLALPTWFALANLLHPLAMIPFGSWGMARYRWHMARGRWYEWIRGQPSP